MNERLLADFVNVWQAWNHAQKISEPRLEIRNTDSVEFYVNTPITYLDSDSHPIFAWVVTSAGSQKDATYQFSQPPWSIAELFFPNVMGKPFPTHQRWSDALPAAERIWTPSIYAGVLTILLALSQFRLWGKRKRHVWLSRIAIFFAVASFGWFGVVWLLNEGLAMFGLSELEVGGIKIGTQVGGLYWFMATFLPKYFMFRYPAKLFVIASLMISVLAGLGITNTSPKRQRVNACAPNEFTRLRFGLVFWHGRSRGLRCWFNRTAIGSGRVMARTRSTELVFRPNGYRGYNFRFEFIVCSCFNRNRECQRHLLADQNSRAFRN